MEKYIERVARYRILRHEELPDQHKAEYRLRGIDPDDLWSLIWSFDERQPAEEQLAFNLANTYEGVTYKLVDNGEAEEIERVAWF